MGGRNKRGIRSASNWRYNVIKRYKKRAETFRRQSETFEEREAWKKVSSWFNDILKTRFLNSSGAIGIPQVQLLEVST